MQSVSLLKDPTTSRGDSLGNNRFSNSRDAHDHEDLRGCNTVRACTLEETCHAVFLTMR
jgi:hypothetical protein